MDSRAEISLRKINNKNKSRRKKTPHDWKTEEKNSSRCEKKTLHGATREKKGALRNNTHDFLRYRASETRLTAKIALDSFVKMKESEKKIQFSFQCTLNNTPQIRVSTGKHSILDTPTQHYVHIHTAYSVVVLSKLSLYLCVLSSVCAAYSTHELSGLCRRIKLNLYIWGIRLANWTTLIIPFFSFFSSVPHFLVVAKSSPGLASCVEVQGTSNKGDADKMFLILPFQTTPFQSSKINTPGQRTL